MTSTGSAAIRWPRASSLLLLIGLAGCAQPPAADLVLYNGVVHTLDQERGTQTAVAAAGEHIVCVGSDAACLETASADARRVDLQGATVIPGLADSHAHLSGIGFREMNLDLSDAASLGELQARVADRVAAATPGEWIVGRGWIEARWEPPVFPTRQDLDAVAPENPVYLVRADGHGAVANSPALTVAGVDAATRAPVGGEILRDSSGEPTGMLLDRAQNLLRPHLPQETPERTRQALILGARTMAERGWTQVSIAGTSWDEVAMLRELIDSGEIGIRIYAAIGGPSEDADRLLEQGPQIDPDGRLDVRSIKLFMDGALGSKGAALLEPYADHDSDGLLMHEPEALEPLFERARAAGVQVQTHAIGDRANRLVLDLYERAFVGLDAAARREARWRIEHAQVLDPADIPRFAELGVIASMQPSHAITDLHFALSRLGPERLRGAYAWRSLIDAGATLAAGSDAPVEKGDPRVELYAASERKGLDGFSEAHWGPEQALSREEALRSLTEWAAYATFQEAWRGAIRPGMWTDLTVFSRDVLTADGEELLAAEVRMTVVGGRIVFER